MKRYFVLILVSMVSISYTQNKQLLYEMDALPQTLLSNPSTHVNFDKHYGIPFMSQLHLNIGSTGINTFDIFEDSQITTLNDRIRIVLDRISTRDFIEGNGQLEIYTFGFRNRKKDYLSGGLFLEGDAIFYIPKNLAILGYEGNSQRNLNREFNFDELVGHAETTAVWHFGISRQVNKKLRLGARAKIYSSISDIRSTDNSGTFITQETPNGPNFYRHSLRNANVTVLTSGTTDFSALSSGETSASPGAAAKIFLGRIFFGGNLGLGADIGFTYNINDQLSISGSAIDLGFISHTKNLESYRISGSYDLEGIELDFPPEDSDGPPPYYQQLIDEIEDEVPLDTLRTKYTTLRPLKLNTSLRFGFDNNYQNCNCYAGTSNLYDNYVGVQLYTVKRPKGFIGAATVYYDKRIANWLRGKVTYTIDSFSYKNIGALASFQGKKLNFYMAADNLLNYRNLAKANSLSLQLGIQLNINDER